MKELRQIKYQCEVCKGIYGTQEQAELCEKQPVTQDKGVKVGDIVLITQGEGKGEKAKVETVFIVDKDWGHYAWKLYWHTVSITAKLINSWGMRQLNFDDYEPIKETVNH